MIDETFEWILHDLLEQKLTLDGLFSHTISLATTERLMRLSLRNVHYATLQ